MKTIFSRWLPAIAKDTTKTAAGVVLLGFIVAGTATAPGAALETDPSSDTSVTPTTLITSPAAQEQPAERDQERSATRERSAEKPSMEKLIPHGTQGAQQSLTPNTEQLKNAEAIVATTKKAGMDERAAVIAVATAMQESTLNNFGHLGDRNDHDSQGLFQQRPSTGWGSPEQITDPEYATTAFLRALQRVDGWQDMPLTSAAQTVQVSAYPFHYAKWERAAADLVQNLWTR